MGGNAREESQLPCTPRSIVYFKHSSSYLERGVEERGESHYHIAKVSGVSDINRQSLGGKIRVIARVKIASRFARRVITAAVRVFAFPLSPGTQKRMFISYGDRMICSTYKSRALYKSLITNPALFPPPRKYRRPSKMIRSLATGLISRDRIHFRITEKTG